MVLDGGVIAAAGPAVTAFTDIHVHLDSTRIGVPVRPYTACLGAMIARGTTRVRSYAQVDTGAGMERLEGVLPARARTGTGTGPM